ELRRVLFRSPRMAAEHAATRARKPVATTSPRCPPYQGSKTGRCDVATVSPISGLENRSLRRRHGVPHIRARKPVAATSPRCPPYQGSKTGRYDVPPAPRLRLLDTLSPGHEILARERPPPAR